MAPPQSNPIIPLEELRFLIGKTSGALATKLGKYWDRIDEPSFASAAIGEEPHPFDIDRGDKLEKASRKRLRNVIKRELTKIRKKYPPSKQRKFARLDRTRLLGTVETNPLHSLIPFAGLEPKRGISDQIKYGTSSGGFFSQYEGITLKQQPTSQIIKKVAYDTKRFNSETGRLKSLIKHGSSYQKSKTRRVRGNGFSTAFRKPGTELGTADSLVWLSPNHEKKELKSLLKEVNKEYANDLKYLAKRLKEDAGRPRSRREMMARGIKLAVKPALPTAGPLAGASSGVAKTLLRLLTRGRSG